MSTQQRSRTSTFSRSGSMAIPVSGSTSPELDAAWSPASGSASVSSTPGVPAEAGAAPKPAIIELTTNTAPTTNSPRMDLPREGKGIRVPTRQGSGPQPIGFGFQRPGMCCRDGGMGPRVTGPEGRCGLGSPELENRSPQSPARGWPTQGCERTRRIDRSTQPLGSLLPPVSPSGFSTCSGPWEPSSVGDRPRRRLPGHGARDPAPPSDRCRRPPRVGPLRPVRPQTGTARCSSACPCRPLGPMREADPGAVSGPAPRHPWSRSPPPVEPVRQWLARYWP